MGFAYFLVYLVAYGGPLLLTAGVTAALALTVFSGLPARWLVSLIVAVTLSCLPVVWERYKLQQDVTALAQDDIWPSQLDLGAGGLLVLSPYNHAGLTCGPGCFEGMGETFPDIKLEESSRVFGWSGSERLGKEDLWSAVEDPNRTAPFPYKYLFLSTEAWRVSSTDEHGPYRKPHWPKSIQGVHMLLAIPPSGLIDFNDAQVLYRRFNLQHDVPQFPFWGFVTKGEQTPYVDDIIRDLSAVLQK